MPTKDQVTHAGPKLTQHANGRVTLNMERSDFQTLLLEAAKSHAGDKHQYLREDIQRLANEIAEFEKVWSQDSGIVYFGDDIKSIFDGETT
jgi:thiamine biosynthesis lipoprotein ApbE